MRDLRGDIPTIALCVLDDAMRAFGRRTSGITDEELACMQQHGWPGNVCELRNEIQRMLIKNVQFAF